MKSNTTAVASWRFDLSRGDYFVLALCVALHFALAVGTNLSVDEAHYALYGALPALSYFDHPPLVGWIQWPFVQLGGSNLAMRIAPMSAWLLTALGMMQLTQRLFPQALDQRIHGLRPDLLLFALSLLPHLLGVAWVPDSALTLITLLVMRLTWSLTRPSSQLTWPTVIVLGGLLGLAGLSKYTAVLLAAGVALVLITSLRLTWALMGRALVISLIALACVSPVVLWNAQHDWISFQYQLHHAQGDPEWHGLFAARYIGVLWLGIGLLFPWCCVMQLQHAARNKEDLPPATTTPTTHIHTVMSAERFSVLLALPSLLVWLYASGHGNALPHWSVPGFTILMPLAAAGLTHLTTRWHRIAISVLSVQALLVLAFSALMLRGDWRLPTDQSHQTTAPHANPFADLHGWQEAAQTAARLAAAHQVDTLSVMNWTLASRLAWYARPWPVKVLDQRQDQFDLWFGPLHDAERAIVVNWSQMPYDLPVQAHQFEHCTLLEQSSVQHWGLTLSHFDFYLCTHWQGALSKAPS